MLAVMQQRLQVAAALSAALGLAVGLVLGPVAHLALQGAVCGGAHEGSG